MKFISLPIFIVSLAFGLFLSYINAPENKIIYVFPTPDNVNEVQYLDKANNCYEFSANKVECPDKSEISDIPIQY